MSGLASGVYFDSTLKLSQEARAHGDLGLWLACIHILSHIDPAAGESELQTGMGDFPISTFLRIPSTEPGSLYWQLMSAYVAARAGHHRPKLG
jgi:hypothetical protein